MMSFVDKIKDKIAQYFETHLGMLKLNAIAYMSRVLGYFAFTIICMFLVFAILLFLGFGLTECYTTWTDSRIAGMFLTVGTYAVLILIVLALRKSIVKLFANAVVRVLTDDEEEEELRHLHDKK